MTTAGYNKCADWFYAHPGWLRMLRGGCRLLPLLLYAGYPVLLLVLALSRDIRFWKVLWIPAAVFVLVTVLRKVINARRPYEVLEIEPLVHKEKKSESFPSRHVASAVILAVAFWYICPPAGIAAGLIALLLAVLRPIAGVHFPRDVLAAAVISLALGIPAFVWLPF
ncbi:MAG: phosphatase PAP2 family protein [Clostridiales bacterium]|nr:MAG: phosphatase PAP2 family protein [Clostridiales bacterium]